MKKAIHTVPWVLSLLLLAGCGSLAEIKEANQLIQADNELVLLVSARQDAAARAVTETLAGSVSPQLVLMGDDALAQAGRRRRSASTKVRLQAVSWYRIAATAYWQSGDSRVIDRLFQAAREGRALCADLGEQAPDRDHLYLMLVIPFAAFEAGANTSPEGLLRDLGAVDFGDDMNTEAELELVRDAFGRLRTMRDVLLEIDTVQHHPTVARHPSLQSYLAENRARAEGFFEEARQKLGSRTTQLRAEFPEAYNALGFEVEDVGALAMKRP